MILPAVQSLRLACSEGAGSENAELGLSAPRGGLGEARVQSLACPGLFGEGRVGRAGGRTPCAERAVILPAVQSLRLAGTEGAGSENAELGLSVPRGGLGEGRVRSLACPGLLGRRVGALLAQGEL